MITVYTGGVYDILHAGHIHLLTRARALGDRLVVGIQADEFVCSVPGKAMPVLRTEERVAQMRAFPFVDEVVVYRSGTTPEIVEQVRPDIFVHGDDWLAQTDRSAVIAYLETAGIRLVLLPRTDGISTTEIRERLRQG